MTNTNLVIEIFCKKLIIIRIKMNDGYYITLLPIVATTND
ncbi:hypothetical protein MNB_SUP05-9-1174 [hydrothermal vent metagenome]|uniref:Uncharacterized protein n=1 Tax=hydrothermal vent metagenome TaxID=652676 RepID=A0A1W1DUH2_9ZZZZ